MRICKEAQAHHKPRARGMKLCKALCWMSVVSQRGCMRGIRSECCVRSLMNARQQSHIRHGEIHWTVSGPELMIHVAPVAMMYSSSILEIAVPQSSQLPSALRSLLHQAQKRVDSGACCISTSAMLRAKLTAGLRGR